MRNFVSALLCHFAQVKQLCFKMLVSSAHASVNSSSFYLNHFGLRLLRPFLIPGSSFRTRLMSRSVHRRTRTPPLRIEKHVSDDRSTLLIRQQRRKQGGGVTDTLKTLASDRDIDLHSALAKIVDVYIGDRKEGFLFETENGKMLSPESLFRDGFKTILKKMGRTGVRFHAFRRFRESVLLTSDARQLLIIGWATKTWT